MSRNDCNHYGGHTFSFDYMMGQCGNCHKMYEIFYDPETYMFYEMVGGTRSNIMDLAEAVGRGALTMHRRLKQIRRNLKTYWRYRQKQIKLRDV